MAEPADHNAETVDGARSAERVQQAVEAFVALHTRGDAPDLEEFVNDYEADLRSRILSQCREYLTFDDMVGHQEWTADADREPEGRPFGDFYIQEELGRGGMGVVYLAQQRSLDRRVALKVMTSGLSLSERHVERFRREALATAQLHHPAIVRVHDFVEVDGAYGLAMEYVAGRNLGDVLSDLALQNSGAETGVDGNLGIAPDKGYVAECAMLAAQVASALAAAHAAKVVHRDLKPSNLMLDDQRRVRLLDFGLAKSLDETRASLSMSGEITGTAHYLSPEQALAKRVEVDQRSDVWALGVILYELLTLKRPFEGKNLQQIVYAISFKEPPALQRRNPRVPRDLATICSKALEKDPQNRYQTAAELEADLQRFLNWEPIQAKPVGPLTRAAKFIRRHRAQAAIAATLLLALTATLCVVAYQRSADARRADELMLRAATRADGGDYAQAIALTNDALRLRNNDITRERLGRYHAENKRVENEAAWKVAESKRLLEFDPEGALRMALEAERQFSTAQTRSAVLAALGGGAATRSLPMLGQATTRSMSWSPSGLYVALAGSRGALLVAPTAGDEAPKSFKGHDPSSVVTSAAFVDEERLVSLSLDRTLKLWRRSSTTPTKSVDLSRYGPLGMLLDASRRRALLVMEDLGTNQCGARAYDTRTGEAIGPFVAHAKHLMDTVIRPDGQVAACCGTNRRLRLWRLEDGEVLVDRALPFETLASAMAFSADGDLVAVGAQDGALAVFRAADGGLIATGRHAATVSALAFSPTSHRVLSGARDFTARIWEYDPAADARPLREVCSLTNDGRPVRAVAFNAAGTLCATAAGDDNGLLRVYDCADDGPKRALYEQRVAKSVKQVAFLPGDRELLARSARRAIVWSVLRSRGATALQQPGKVESIAFVGDGERLVSTGDDERLRMWDRRDGRLIWETEPMGLPIERLAVAPAGDRIAVALVDGKMALHASADGRRLVDMPAASSRVTALHFLTAESLLVAGGDDGRGHIDVWDLQTQTRTRRVEAPAPVAAAAVSAAGDAIATIHAGAGAARLWTLPDLAPVGEVGAADADYLALAFAPSGDALLLCDSEARAQRFLLDGSAGAVITTNGAVQHASYSRDGRYLLTCSRTGTAQLWRGDDGARALNFEGHLAPLRCGALSRDGDWAASSARDGSIWIWPTDPVEVAEQLPTRARPPGRQR